MTQGVKGGETEIVSVSGRGAGALVVLVIFFVATAIGISLLPTTLPASLVENAQNALDKASNTAIAFAIVSFIALIGLLMLKSRGAYASARW